MGLLSICAFTLLAIISYKMFRNIGIKLLLIYLKRIQMTDCCPYNPLIYSKEKYFLRKHFVKKGREENLYILESFINNKKPAFNNVYDNLESILN